MSYVYMHRPQLGPRASRRLREGAVGLLALIAASLAMITAAQAQRREPGTGPVVAACQEDIGKYCEGKEHVTAQGQRGGVRACLIANRAKLSTECRKALDATGPGSRRGRGMGRGMSGMGGMP